MICEVGTYAELIDSNGAFAEFMRTYASTEDNNEEKEGNCSLLNCCGSVAHANSNYKQ